MSKSKKKIIFTALGLGLLTPFTLYGASVNKNIETTKIKHLNSSLVNNSIYLNNFSKINDDRITKNTKITNHINDVTSVFELSLIHNKQITKKEYYAISSTEGISLVELDSVEKTPIKISNEKAVSNSLFEYYDSEKQISLLFFRTSSGILKKINLSNFNFTTPGALAATDVLNLKSDGDFIQYNYLNDNNLSISFSNDYGIFYINDIDKPVWQVVKDSSPNNSWGRVLNVNGSNVLFYGGQDGVFKQNLSIIKGDGGEKITDKMSSYGQGIFSTNKTFLYFSTTNDGIFSYNINRPKESLKQINNFNSTHSSMEVVNINGEDHLYIGTKLNGLWDKNLTTKKVTQILKESLYNGDIKYLENKTEKKLLITTAGNNSFTMDLKLNKSEINVYKGKIDEMPINWSIAGFGKMVNFYDMVNYSNTKKLYFTEENKTTNDFELYEYENSTKTKINLQNVDPYDIVDINIIKSVNSEFKLIKTYYKGYKLLINNGNTDTLEIIPENTGNNFANIYYDSMLDKIFAIKGTKNGLFKSMGLNYKSSNKNDFPNQTDFNNSWTLLKRGDFSGTTLKISSNDDGETLLITKNSSGVKYINMTTPNKEEIISSENAKQGEMSVIDYKNDKYLIYKLYNNNYYIYSFKNKTNQIISNLQGQPIDKLWPVIHMGELVFIYETYSNGIWYRDWHNGEDKKISNSDVSEGTFWAYSKENSSGEKIAHYVYLNPNTGKSYDGSIGEIRTKNIDSDVSEGSAMATFSYNDDNIILYANDSNELWTYNIQNKQKIKIGNSAVDNNRPIHIYLDKTTNTNYAIFSIVNNGTWIINLDQYLSNSSSIVEAKQITTEETFNSSTISGNKFYYASGENGIVKQIDLSSSTYISKTLINDIFAKKNASLKIFKELNGSDTVFYKDVANNNSIFWIKNGFSERFTASADIGDDFNVIKNKGVKYLIYEKFIPRGRGRIEGIFKYNIDTKKEVLISKTDSKNNAMFNYKINNTDYLIIYTKNNGISRVRMSYQSGIEDSIKQWRLTNSNFAIVEKKSTNSNNKQVKEKYIVFQSDMKKGLWIQSMQNLSNESDL